MMEKACYITNIYDEQALKQERQSLFTIMEEIYDTHESLMSLDPLGETPPPPQQWMKPRKIILI